MIKKILLPLDPTSYTETAAHFAINLAKMYNAEITGLVVLDIPGIKSHTGPLPPGVGFYVKELENTKIDAAKVHIQNLLSKYKHLVESNGVSFIEAKAQGSPSDKIKEFAKFYDVLIIGQKNNYHFEISDEFENSIQDVVDTCSTPFFAVPDTLTKFNSNNEFKVIIAFNDSHSSVRTLQRFAQMELPKKLNVTVFISSEDKDKANFQFDLIKSFLNSHGIEKVDSIITSKDKIKFFSDEILNDTDIIVLGAHSKKGIIDFMYGSLTRYLINENKNLLFICQ